MITRLNLVKNMAKVKRVGNAIFGFAPINLLSKHERWKKQVKLLKLSKQAKNRLDWIIYYETKAKNNASLTCRHFGIPPKTFYKWKNRFDGKNLKLLEDQIETPINKRKRAITPTQEMRIVALRKKYIRYGKIKIMKKYERKYKESISSWKIQYTIQKYKLYYHPIKNEKLQKKRKRSQCKKRVTELKKKPFSGFLISLDIIVLHINNTKRYIVTAIDEVSKIAFARMYTSKSSKNAGDFLQRMFYLLDGSMLNTLNDNGSEFHKEFIKACNTLDLSQYWSRVHTPKDNPFCERFNRTLKEEFLQLGNYTSDVLRFNQELTEWLVEYNFGRPHQALGYDTPWEFYSNNPRVKSKYGKVLPMYSSRTTP